ncbi:MAG: hypothetical protein GX603_00945 [Chloroflexi bacterium]|nr:hypothetical protein [Chloroflexota bacterium]
MIFHNDESPANGLIARMQGRNAVIVLCNHKLNSHRLVRESMLTDIEVASFGVGQLAG